MTYLLIIYAAVNVPVAIMWFSVAIYIRPSKLDQLKLLSLVLGLAMLGAVALNACVYMAVVEYDAGNTDKALRIRKAIVITSGFVSFMFNTPHFVLAMNYY